MTFLVARRVREIGVRMALGASERDVVRLALSQAVRLTAIGRRRSASLLAVALGRAMEAGLLGIVSSDIRMTAALAVLLAVTAVAAGYLPARRAASVDHDALRSAQRDCRTFDAAVTSTSAADCTRGASRSSRRYVPER